MANKSTTHAGYISNPLELIAPSFEAFKLNLTAFLAALAVPVAAAAIFVSLVTAAFIAGSNTVATLFPLVIGGALAVVVIALLLAPTITVVMLKGAKGERVGAGEAFREGSRYIGRFFVIGILSALAFIGGLLLLVIPGFIFGIWFSLAFYVAIDEDLPAIAAMKRSKQLVAGHFWEMAGMLSLGSAFGILDVIPVVGWIASTVLGIIYTPAVAIRYLQLKQYGSEPAKTHVMNYVAIVLAFVAVGMSSARKPQAEDQKLPAILDVR